MLRRFLIRDFFVQEQSTQGAPAGAPWLHYFSKPFWPAWLLVLAGLLATLYFVDVIRRDELADRELRFTAISNNIVAAMQESLSAYEVVLRTGGALLQLKPELTPGDWNHFASSIDINAAFPGLRSIGFIGLFRAGEQASFLERHRSKIAPDFRIDPPCGDEICGPVLLTERLDAHESVVTGFNVASEPMRREALLKAVSSGRPTVTRRIRLMDKSTVPPRAGVLLVSPLPNMEDGADTAEQRLAKAWGVTYGAIDVDDFSKKAIQNRDPNYLSTIRVRAFEHSTNGRFPLFDSAPETNAPDEDLQRTVALDLNGTIWQLDFSAREAFFDAQDRMRVWVAALVGLAFTLAAGFIGFVVVRQRDMQRALANIQTLEVSRRKKAEEDLQIALRELGHRIKNMLTVVTSIASQTARHCASMADFDAAFRQRMRGLSEVNDLLATRQEFDTDMAALADKILKPFRTETQASIQTEGGRIPVAANTAILLSILINEFATNAMKYGALSVPHGKILLSWELKEEDGNRFVRLAWRESDGPPVVKPSHSGFGSNVIRFVVERSLRGRAAIDYRSDGVICLVEIPWDSESSEVSPPA